MKVKNIMFSGFAAAILMGVGAANAAVANPVTLADQGYVDAKVKVVADEVATKEASANKFTDVTKEAWKSADKAVAFPTIGVAEQIALDSVAQISADVKDLSDIRSGVNKATEDIAKLNGDAETAGSVAHSIAAALKTAEDDATAKADQALADAKADTTAQINALKLSETYDSKGAAAAALTAANQYTDAEITKLNVSQYAKTADVEATYATKTEIADANYASQTEAQGYATAAVEALKIGDYAKTADVEATYATKTEISDANYASKTEAEGYATAAVEALKIEDYAKTADVNAELAKKLDKSEIDKVAGTYMVTSDGAGNFTYTQVKVATVDGEGKTTVTQ